MGYNMRVIETSAGYVASEYFDCNIWMMSDLRHYMFRTGMADGVDKLPTLSHDDLPEVRERSLSYRGSVKGMALHKFGSNDHWVVTPDEIEEALTIWDQTPEELKLKAPERWMQWLDFLLLAKKRKGFIVG